ncbi:MAG: DUF4292 domain-containing protein [Capnocytophaga sp.]|nr:DUF4292 domain-containing protein [Capnocytophaga sp.]
MKINNIVYRISIFLIVLSQLAVSCKTKTAVVASGSVNRDMKVKEIVRLHEMSYPDFKTVSGSVSAFYDDGKNSQSIPLTFRMEKDKAIWLSAPLGVAKVMITPEKASYYNRLDNTYFDGGFDYISELLGFEVDFENLQNLLLGQAIYPLETNSKIIIDEQMYHIEAPPKQAIQSSYGILPDNFRMGKFQAVDPVNQVNATADITYQQAEGNVMPSIIRIQAADSEGVTTIELDFKNLKFGSSLNFPFKIPSGSKRIDVK